jgi:hypothetical protein
VNYRHAFHAGNFADVFKHAVLCRILHYLREKPAAFRVIDSHAGAGLYDLSAAEAIRGGEWHDGIARLMAAELAAPVAALLAPYLEVVAALNERGRLKTYPGSPALVRAWLRPQDRLVACEIDPKAAIASFSEKTCVGTSSATAPAASRCPMMRILLAVDGSALLARETSCSSSTPGFFVPPGFELNEMFLLDIGLYLLGLTPLKSPLGKGGSGG